MDYTEKINEMINRDKMIRENLDLRMKQIKQLQERFATDDYTNDDVRLMGELEREQLRERDAIAPDI